MEAVEMSIQFAGGAIDIKLFPQEDFRGVIYPVEMNGNYVFTLFLNEDEHWVIMREPDGTTPIVDGELFKSILKRLQYILRYAA